MKRVVLGILTGLLVACNNQDNPEVASATNCQTLEHDQGETEVCDQPRKVVALNPSMLEILLALGVQPVGYADYFPSPVAKFDNPSQQILFLGERVTNQPINLGTADDPSLETIAQLEPDLILGDTYANEDESELLSQIAPTLLFTYAVDEDWQEQMRVVAKALGKSEQAEAVIAQHSERVAQAKTALEPVVNQYPKILLLGSEQIEAGIEIDPYNHDSYCSSLLEDVGFELVFPPNSAGKEAQGGQVSLELLTQLDADSILIQAYNTDFGNGREDLVNEQIAAVQQQWNNNAIAQSLSASQQNQVYFTSAYLCRALPGPIGAEIFLEQLQQYF